MYWKPSSRADWHSFYVFFSDPEVYAKTLGIATMEFIGRQFLSQCCQPPSSLISYQTSPCVWYCQDLWCAGMVFPWCGQGQDPGGIWEDAVKSFKSLRRWLQFCQKLKPVSIVDLHLQQHRSWWCRGINSRTLPDWTSSELSTWSFIYLPTYLPPASLAQVPISCETFLETMAGRVPDNPLQMCKVA